MTRIIASEQSLKSLAYLDGLFLSDPDRYISIITATEDEPLVRLVLAAISRIDTPALDFSEDTLTQFTNMAISNNIGGFGKMTEDGILRLSGANGTLQLMLSDLVVRYLKQLKSQGAVLNSDGSITR